MHNYFIRFAWVIIATAGTVAFASNHQTYVIPTYGNPDELIAVVQGALHDGGAVSSYQDKLIVRASAADYARIQALLSQIDISPSPIVLSVQVGNHVSQSSNGGQINIGISHGAWVDGNYYNTQNQQNNHNSYQVRGLSGRPMHIGTRTLISLIGQYQQQGYSPYGGYHIRWIGQQWASLSDGINATVRQLPNGQLQLTLLQSSHQGLKTGQFDTEFIINRGQWVQAGEITSSTQINSNRHQSSHLSTVPIWVKVD